MDEGGGDGSWGLLSDRFWLGIHHANLSTGSN